MSIQHKIELQFRYKGRPIKIDLCHAKEDILRLSKKGHVALSEEIKGYNVNDIFDTEYWSGEKCGIYHPEFNILTSTESHKRYHDETSNGIRVLSIKDIVYNNCIIIRTYDCNEVRSKDGLSKLGVIVALDMKKVDLRDSFLVVDGKKHNLPMLFIMHRIAEKNKIIPEMSIVRKTDKLIIRIGDILNR